MNRPLVWVAVTLALGTWAGGEAWIPGLLAPLGIFLFGMALAIAVPQKPQFRLVSIAFCSFALGVLLWNVRHMGPPGDPVSRLVESAPNGRWTMSGRVQRANLYAEDTSFLRFTVNVDELSADGKTYRAAGSVQVGWQDPARPVFTGQRVRLEGAATSRIGTANPSIYDAADQLTSERTFTQLSVRSTDGVRILEEGPWWSLRYQTARFRATEAAWFREIAPPQVLPFVYAVWLGDRAYLPRDVYATYRLSGIAHILAVSGVHVGIIFASTMFALRLFVKSGRYRALIAMVTVVLFAFVAGASVTSLRAALMVCIYLVAELFDREPDTPTALSLAAIFFLGYNPDVLYHIGFQLSFASVASILIFSPPIERLLGPLPFVVRQAVAVSLAVQILPVPLTASYFHVLPVLGPLVNLIAVPLLTVALWLCFLSALTAGVSLAIATVFAHALAPVLEIIRTVAGWGASVQHLMPAITSPTLAAAVLYVLAILAAVGMRAATDRGRMIHRCMVVVTLVVVAVFWRDWWPEPSVTFLDVRHGDATVILSPEGKVAVIDAGNSNEFTDYGERVVAPYLWSRGITQIDHLFLTHADRDHMGGALYLLDAMTVGEALLGPIPGESATEREVIGRCAAQSVPVKRIVAGEVFDLGGAQLHVLHPPAEWPGNHDDNNLSIVMRLDWDGTRVLFPGDIEAEAEALVAHSACRADVLKVPHHGSRTSSSPAFIDAVAPRIAVVSTGGQHGREAVSSVVLDRYAQRGIPVLRTDELGAIVLTIEDGTRRLLGTRRPSSVNPLQTLTLHGGTQ